MHFPAKGKRKSADTYEIQRLGFQADQIAKWVAERTEVVVSVSEKFVLLVDRRYLECSTANIDPLNSGTAGIFQISDNEL